MQSFQERVGEHEKQARTARDGPGDPSGPPGRRTTPPRGFEPDGEPFHHRHPSQGSSDDRTAILSFEEKYPGQSHGYRQSNDEFNEVGDLKPIQVRSEPWFISSL